MNIYLDIDGVLLSRGWKPAPYVAEFLRAATERHDCYWLTTHCTDGNAQQTIEYLSKILSSDTLKYCNKIKPTTWSFQKTNAIDFSSPFLWFDDAPMDYEKEILAQNGLSDSLVLVNLQDNPNHLKDLVKLL